MSDPNLVQLFAGISVMTALRYFFFAGLAWLLGYVWLRRQWFHRKVVQRLPESVDVRREMKDSLIALLMFGLVGTATVWAALHGWTRMYWHIDQRGWGWWWASVAVAILLHDAWFYWTHRLMHHPRLFRHCHRTHHLSMNPTPWAAFAFHPLEALAQAAIFPLVVTLMPVHPLAFGLFMVWQLIFNVVGHAGYEYNRPWLTDSWLRFIINTPTNHVMHHEKMRGNFGLYFNYWDRLMGTNHADYEQRLREVTSRVASIPARAGEAVSTRPTAR